MYSLNLENSVENARIFQKMNEITCVEFSSSVVKIVNPLVKINVIIIFSLKD